MIYLGDNEPTIYLGDNTPNIYLGDNQIYPTGPFVGLKITRKVAFSSISLQATIKVKSSEAWTLTTDAAWLSLSETAGTATSGTVITLTATAQSAATTSYISATTANYSAVCQCDYNVRDIVPNNEIWYTSSNGQAVTPTRPASWYGVNSFVSNTYVNGKGILVADTAFTSTAGSGFLNAPLTMINVPDSVTSLDAESFKGVNNFTLIAGTGVTSINEGNFGGANLIKLYSPNTPTVITDSYGGSVRHPWTYNNGIAGELHYPHGADYSTLLQYMPNNWTAYADL